MLSLFQLMNDAEQVIIYSSYVFCSLQVWSFAVWNSNEYDICSFVSFFFYSNIISHYFWYMKDKFVHRRNKKKLWWHLTLFSTNQLICTKILPVKIYDCSYKYNLTWLLNINVCVFFFYVNTYTLFVQFHCFFYIDLNLRNISRSNSIGIIAQYTLQIW